MSGAFARTVLESLGQTLWGFRPRLMREIVERLGSAGSLAWFARNMPRYERTLATWGPLRTHLSALSASLANSCGYCTYGHAYAFNLHFFKTHERVFPIDEARLASLAMHEGDGWQQALRAALEREGMSAEVAAIARLFELMAGDPPQSDDDRRALHLVKMFAALNHCGVDSRAMPDEAHSPINKDRALRERYAAARAAARAS